MLYPEIVPSAEVRTVDDDMRTGEFGSIADILEIEEHVRTPPGHLGETDVGHIIERQLVLPPAARGVHRQVGPAGEDLAVSPPELRHVPPPIGFLAYKGQK